MLGNVAAASHGSVPASASPVCRLSNWLAFRIGEDVYVFGWDNDRERWRRSTAVRAVYSDTRSLITRSGRIYRLLSVPCSDRDNVEEFYAHLRKEQIGLSQVLQVTDQLGAIGL